MVCVTNVWYSTRFNNVPLEPFTPSRGLRQGDPLSPYLFIFVANGFFKLIQREVRQQRLQELHICRRVPGVSHLLFVDDTLMFFKASEDQARIVNGIITSFEKGTGQIVNLAKCSMVFGSKCPDQERKNVLEILHVSNRKWKENTWGCPPR
jgi:hypothetical protein